MEPSLWRQRLCKTAEQYEFQDGYKLLYCPWENIHTSQIAFISLNPGVLPDYEVKETLSDERGNSYEVEQLYSKSPFTEQFLKMCHLLGIEPHKVLTGVIHPFRSHRWRNLSKEQRIAGLDIGRDFWSVALSPQVHTIIVSGNTACDEVVQITRSRIKKRLDSGWGTCQFEVYETLTKQRLIKLPHLSTYKIFSRSQCASSLQTLFTLDGPLA